MNVQITVVLPGLLSCLQQHSQEAPALTKLLSKAAVHVGPASVEHSFLAIFPGLVSPIPYAALSALDQGLISSDNQQVWCFINRVKCLVTHQTAYIVGDEPNHTQAQKRKLCSLLGQLSTNELTFYESAAEDLLCKVDNHTRVTMQPVMEVYHKNLLSLLPQGEDKAFWHRLLTMSQMLLQAEQSSQESLSSLWFWGLGKLPLSISCDTLYSDASFVRGLAKLASKPISSIASFNQHEIKENSVIIALDFYRLSKQQALPQHSALIAFYEKAIFSPLLEKLLKNEINKVRIICANGVTFETTRMRLKYFWKKTYPLAHFAVKEK